MITRYIKHYGQDGSTFFTEEKYFKFSKESNDDSLLTPALYAEFVVGVGGNFRKHRPATATSLSEVYLIVTSNPILLKLVLWYAKIFKIITLK